MFVVDTVVGKLQVGSSAGGLVVYTSSIQTFGALNSVELDGATGNITTKGKIFYANNFANLLILQVQQIIMVCLLMSMLKVMDTLHMVDLGHSY